MSGRTFALLFVGISAVAFILAVENKRRHGGVFRLEHVKRPPQWWDMGNSAHTNDSETNAIPVAGTRNTSGNPELLKVSTNLTFNLSGATDPVYTVAPKQIRTWFVQINLETNSVYFKTRPKPTFGNELDGITGIGGTVWSEDKWNDMTNRLATNLYPWPLPSVIDLTKYQRAEQ